MITTQPAIMTKYSSHLQPKDETVLNVYKTFDYDRFKILTGNRTVNEIHVKRLISSFEKNHLISIIAVNEKWQIIDGQHRFLASKQKGLPIYYVILTGYGIEEVKVLNTNSTNWNKADYLKTYCDLGFKPYLQMRQFMNDFPDFGMAVSECLLTNTTGGANNKATVLNGKGRARNFQEGQMKIENLMLAYENAEKVMMFKPYYDGFNRAVFVMALIGLFKNENYNHDEMINKISKNPTSLQHCSNVTQYKLALEEIYNFRRAKKVNLRY